MSPLFVSVGVQSAPLAVDLILLFPVVAISIAIQGGLVEVDQRSE